MNTYRVTVWPYGRIHEAASVTLGARDAKLANEFGLAMLAPDTGTVYVARAARMTEPCERCQAQLVEDEEHAASRALHDLVCK